MEKDWLNVSRPQYNVLGFLGSLGTDDTSVPKGSKADSIKPVALDANGAAKIVK